MSENLYYYSSLSQPQLRLILSEHSKDFSAKLEEAFSPEEMASLEKMLDSLASVTVQEKLLELTFDDLNFTSEAEAEQRLFFERCRFCICFENMPYLETHPFQVSYLMLLLERLGHILVDQGGMHDLLDGADFLQQLKGHKNITARLLGGANRPVLNKTPKVKSPIDFLIGDVYAEFARLKQRDVHIPSEHLPEKTQKLFSLMELEELDAHTLLTKSGLIPKDFGDHLERLKFFLKKY